MRLGGPQVGVEGALVSWRRLCVIQVKAGCARRLACASTGLATALAAAEEGRHPPALQVPGSAGALAVYVLPRYLLHNALDVPIQYKQQGAGGSFTGFTVPPTTNLCRVGYLIHVCGWALCTIGPH